MLQSADLPASAAQVPPAESPPPSDTSLQSSDTVLRYHEAAMLFPPLAPEQYAKLKQDIQEHGQAQPIIVHKGYIIDGRSRHDACVELKRKPWIVEYDGPHLQP